MAQVSKKHKGLFCNQLEWDSHKLERLRKTFRAYGNGLWQHSRGESHKSK